jgi:hypothetical protein
MKCARCKAKVELGARFCVYCGAAAADEARLAWDDPLLAVASDPPMRRKYRLLQSWYREHVLDADYGFSFRKGPRPVGSLLAPEAVADAPDLNFLCDDSFLRYVDQRVPEVQAANGTLEEHRLRHNMLSSMPMAFSFAAALRQAHDRASIVSGLFGVACHEVIEVFAEWIPERPKSELLNDRTAFDAAILYRCPDGGTGLIGIETKYTEPLSQREYLSDRYVEITERCGWFRSGAHTDLVGSATNQLWRNAMLAAVTVGLTVDDAHLAIIGLDEDDSLWDAADSVAAHMAEPKRLLLRPWNQVVDAVSDTPLEIFAKRFNQRYLNTTPLQEPHLPVCVQRPSSTNSAQHRWNFVGVTERPHPSEAAVGELDAWSTWLPTVWRALSDPARTLAIPTSPPSDFGGPLGWWTPLVHLMAYSFAWQSPAQGLANWHNAGRPIDDPRLSLIETIWGERLDAMLDHLWRGCGNYESVAESLHLSPVELPADSPELPALTAASTVGHNPSTGGCDPLHLGSHFSSPLTREPQGTATMTTCDPGVSGPARAILRSTTYQGWYRALHERGNELPGRPQGHGWRVDVVVDGIGYLGTYRRSRQTKRWFAGRHGVHQLGVV